jgi:ribosome biogenesis protein BMS1
MLKHEQDSGTLRRAAGVGAPREADSLYKQIKRAPRVFNPLKVPMKLQAALPFKTKPKVVIGVTTVCCMVCYNNV